MIPAVPTFSVDGGFWYSLPESHRSRVGLGTIVRVPLGGRRVRGYVVEVASRPATGLKAIAGVSGELAVFGPKLRDALVWAAHHYVAPISVLLEKAAPPNLPSAVTSTPPPAPATRGASRLDELVGSSVAGRRRPVTALLTSWGDMSWLESLAPLVAAGKSAMVVVATSAEVELVAAGARRALGPEALLEATGEMDDAELTEVWARAASLAGRVLVGTPRVAAWPVADLALSLVLEEGRRSMKDRQTPTLSVRRLLMTRGRLEGFGQVYVGPTPSLDLLAAGPDVIRTRPRAWPLVEVVDRTEEPPGSGLVSQRVRTAITATIRQNGLVFVFTHRRGYAPAYRCARCRELRRCRVCGSRPEPGAACLRCGAPSEPCLVCGGEQFEPLGAGVGRVRAELDGLFGGQVGEVGSGSPITVGTERDLAGLPGVDLAVAVDVDGLALGSHFRAAEEALRVLARLAGHVRRGSGHRLMLQTSLADQPLIGALRRGDPIEFLDVEMGVRQEMGYPPATEMMVVEIRGEEVKVDADLRSIAGDGVSVMGPAVTATSHRWLIQGTGLGGYKLGLRPLVQRWRDTGSTVRIDVDPLDL